MSKQETLDRISKLGLLAVIRGPSAELTVPMVEALMAGGVKGIEITYSTPRAASVVRKLKQKYGEEIVLGMGTLTQCDQVVEATAAGATFLVSPHVDEELGRAMTSSGLAAMIGALTPSEVVRASRLGADVIKIFPGMLGGPAYLKALRGPFPNIPMMPTGGVSAENVGDWFAAGAFAVGAGSELCPPRLAGEGRFEEITARAYKFVAAVEKARASK
jgi:2-dehydro-3-deoxyphosphogluconate aldolase/(4S)-4-hydroxy-2-oxoglutarate aldolase